MKGNQIWGEITLPTVFESLLKDYDYVMDEQTNGWTDQQTDMANQPKKA